MREKTFLTILTFVVACTSIFTLGALVVSFWVHDHAPTATANAAGEVAFCINGAPNITVPCNTTLSQGEFFFCQLNLSDVDGNNVTATVSFVTGSQIFNLTQNGTINFTPSNEDVGNYSVLFTANDGSDCANENATAAFDFQVANINDPPVLVRTIPDQTLATNTTLSAFFLNDYFIDPDGDALTYNVSLATGLSILIAPSSEVRLSSTVCITDGVLVTFTAYDPFNESAESNAVEITVTCDQPGGGGGGGSSGGGGGGGGGGIIDCRSNWECQEWFPCLPAGVQWRRCYDLNACEAEKYLQRGCPYVGPPLECTENWLCSEWTVCYANSTQHRSCEDLNECGTAVVRPPDMQSCLYIPTCTDGIRNGNETGVDCGGGCPSCPLIEQPLPISDLDRLGRSLWLWILLIILLLSFVARYYRGEIAQGVASLAYLLSRKKPKDVLLSKAQRRQLFERTAMLEAGLRTLPPQEAADRLASLIRSYAHEALGVELESLPEEVAEVSKKYGLQQACQQAIVGIFKKAESLETKEFEPAFLVLTLEELRSLICVTSEYEQEEIMRPISEIAVTEKMSYEEEFMASMTNILRAAQFRQLDLAKKAYVQLLSKYGALTEQEKERVYPELLWVFHSTRIQDEARGVRLIARSA